MSVRRKLALHALAQIKEYLEMEQKNLRVVKPELVFEFIASPLCTSMKKADVIDPGPLHQLAYVTNGKLINMTYACFTGVHGLEPGDVFRVYKIPRKMCETECCRRPTISERRTLCFPCAFDLEQQNKKKY